MAELTLTELGWDEAFAAAFQPHAAEGLVPGRICLESRGAYRVLTASGEHTAERRGRLRHEAQSRADLPAVGDWVALRPGRERWQVEAVLPRRTRFLRRAAGEPLEEQVVAANIDTVFLVSGLDADFNPRRIERYVVTTWESGARPVVVLNKADLAADLEAKILAVEQAAPGVSVLAVSARLGEGLEALREHLPPGRTVAFLGSSGAGKSTLINRLLGAEVLRTADVRAHDQRGRHTTTSRQLLRLPWGALVIDTPGMRELQLWDAEAGLQDAFEDLEALAASCQFRDCQHRSEPGCAVRAAVKGGELPAERLQSFHKLKAEAAHIQRERDVQARLAEKRRWKTIHKAQRKYTPRG